MVGARRLAARSSVGVGRPAVASARGGGLGARGPSPPGPVGLRSV